MKPSFPERCGRVQAGALAVLALSLIWLPALDSLLHLDTAPLPNENRALAGFPEFKSGSKSPREYIAGLERYYNDHFGFRKRLIRWQHQWKHNLFNDIPSSNDTIVGRDGWLFYSGDKTIETVQGINPFTPDELKGWKQLLERRRDWCVQHGSAYLLVVPPDKHSIYPEYLPDWLLPIEKPTKLDQFLAYMKTNSTVAVLDLRLALLQAKTSASVYFVTDSHWNALGAFVGYQSLIGALAEQMPGLKPLPLDAFARKLVPAPGQDLARYIGQEEAMVETGNMVLTPLPPLEPLTVAVNTNTMVKNWRMNTSTKNPESKGKAIVFHDSYAISWQPFLGYNFNEVIFTWESSWDLDFLERQKPDVVIDEILERHLTSENPNRELNRPARQGRGGEW